MEHDYTFTQNRELSWLKFNQRVLAEALDENVPLFEKLNFLQIFCSNLDEFIMVRVGRLTDLSLLKDTKPDKRSGLSPKEELKLIFDNLIDLYREKDRVFSFVENKFREKGIYNLEIYELTKAQRKAIYKYFEEYIQPILSPQVIGFEHPFPFLENGSEYLILELEKNGERRFGLMALPDIIPKIVKLPSSTGYPFIRSSKVINEFARECYPKSKILSKTIIRVTRNADLSADDEIAYDEVDYRSHMKKILKKRHRLQSVRIEANEKGIEPFKKLLCEKLNIEENQIFESYAPLSMDYVSELKKYLSEDFISQYTYGTYLPNLGEKIGLTGDLISKIKERDYLLSYPYDSMEPFIKLIEQAAHDNRVISIKITIYRLAKNSRLVQQLCRAAENGKEVVVIMELRARFDEQSNLDYSKKLYDAGCHIIYGMSGYKVHSKICLITLQDINKWWHITQIGTGNYNEITAGIYTDFSLITSKSDIGLDAIQFFKNMSTGNLQGSYKRLLQSPSTLKRSLLEMIDEEIEKKEDGYIFFKMNSLTDRDFIDKFMEASRAGVKVKLIIRGICCILPGVPGKTENIEVHSIVGRLLEHARVYMFGKEDSKVYIGSADLMTRNTENRVELITPILDNDIKNRIIKYMDIQFKDNVKGRVLNQYGKLNMIDNQEEKLNSQQYFMDEEFREEYEDTPLSFFNMLRQTIRRLIKKAN